MKALFESPTVAGMAAVIAEHQARKAGQEDIELMLAELEAMSDEQAAQILAEEAELSQRRKGMR